MMVRLLRCARARLVWRAGPPLLVVAAVASVAALAVLLGPWRPR